MGQSQVFKKVLHELFLAQGEREIILALARVAGLALAASCAAAFGPRNAVTAKVVGVAGVNGVPHAALAVVEGRLADVFFGEGDVLRLLHIADAAP